MVDTFVSSTAVHPGPPADFAEHEKTYHGVTHLFRWFIAHMALLLIGLYFLVLGNGAAFGTFLVMVSVVVLGYGIVSTPSAAETGGDKALAHEDAEGYRIPE